MEQRQSIGQNLSLYSPERAIFKDQTKPDSPNAWFCQRYPDQFYQHGSPFLELTERLDQFTTQTICVSINQQFFAACLGGRKDLKHHVIYYESELTYYFKDVDGIYKPTTGEKLANLYRALLLRSLQEMTPSVHKLNLFHEFTSDKYAKAVVQKAKSLLLADPSFFRADGPNQRIRGIEIMERVARVFVESLLTKEAGQVLVLQDAYAMFRGLLKDRELPDIKRSVFQSVVAPLIRDQFDVALRNDLSFGDRSGVRGWKDVKVIQAAKN
jgi:hypothetical protein